MAQNYKIFINEIPVIIHDGSTAKIQEQSNNFNPIFSFDQKEEIKKAFTLIETGSYYKSLNIVGTNAKEIRKYIFQNYTVIKAAGGLVFNSKDEILMIFRRGVWDLPKGKLEISEKKKIAALREVREETGILKLNILKKIMKTYHTYTINGKKILKVTHWYLMMSDDAHQLVPQQEEDIEIVKWISVNDLDAKLKKTYSTIKEVIQTGITLMHHG